MKQIDARIVTAIGILVLALLSMFSVGAAVDDALADLDGVREMADTNSLALGDLAQSMTTLAEGTVKWR